MQDYERAAIDFAAKLASLGLSVTCEFVPQSQSRNAGESALSLNWRCAILRNGAPIRGIEAVDYMQGIGHAPSHKSPPKFADGRVDKWQQSQCAKVEAETGKQGRVPGLSGRVEPMRNKPLSPPSAADVFSSLCLDSDALDYSTFEDWAECLGYDPDSRKGEAIYRLCLAHGLALRAAIGDDELQALRALANEM